MAAGTVCVRLRQTTAGAGGASRGVPRVDSRKYVVFLSKTTCTGAPPPERAYDLDRRITILHLRVQRNDRPPEANEIRSSGTCVAPLVEAWPLHGVAQADFCLRQDRVSVMVDPDRLEGT